MAEKKKEKTANGRNEKQNIILTEIIRRTDVKIPRAKEEEQRKKKLQQSLNKRPIIACVGSPDLHSVDRG